MQLSPAMRASKYTMLTLSYPLSLPTGRERADVPHSHRLHLQSRRNRLSPNHNLRLADNKRRSVSRNVSSPHQKPMPLPSTSGSVHHRRKQAARLLITGSTVPSS